MSNLETSVQAGLSKLTLDKHIPALHTNDHSKRLNSKQSLAMMWLWRRVVGGGGIFFVVVSILDNVTS